MSHKPLDWHRALAEHTGDDVRVYSFTPPGTRLVVKGRGYSEVGSGCVTIDLEAFVRGAPVTSPQFGWTSVTVQGQLKPAIDDIVTVLVAAMRALVSPVADAAQPVVPSPSCPPP